MSSLIGILRETVLRHAAQYLLKSGTFRPNSASAIPTSIRNFCEPSQYCETPRTRKRSLSKI